MNGCTPAGFPNIPGMSQKQPEAADRLQVLRWPEVHRRTGLPRRTISRLMATGDFPRSFRVGLRAVGWLAGEVDDWLAERLAERGGQR